MRIFQYFLFFYAFGLSAQTSEFRASGLNSSDIYSIILDEKSGAVLEKNQESSLALPASIMKMVSSVAALELLQKNHAWTTEFWLDSDTQTLYIVGNGDPKITWEDMLSVFHQLRAQGIVNLPGGIVLDAQVIGPIAEKVFDGQDLKPYNVTPHGLLLNFKAVGFKWIPNTSGGKQPMLEPKPWPKQIEVVNQVKQVSGSCGDWKDKLNASFHNNKNSAKVVFKGSYASSCGEREWFVSLLDHEHFNQGFVEWVWREAKMEHVGKIRVGVLPSKSDKIKLVATHRSAPLSRLLADVNQFSNNVMARHVLLRIAQQKHGKMVSEQQGAELVKSWWKSRQFGDEAIVIENGSGLSRQERLSALGLGKMLVYAGRQDYAVEFINSLVKIDSASAKRYGRQISAQLTESTAYVKTGTLNDVRSLAGYVRKANAPGLVFVIMVNSEKTNAAEQAVDAYLRHVVTLLNAR